jgi:ABC-type phosphate transport system permease subunit
MKKQVFLLIILSILTINTSAQFWYNKYYSNKNLSELNSKELSFLHEKSSQTLNTGVILTIVGSGVTVVGCAIFIYRISHDIGDWDYSGDTFYNIVTIATLTGVVVAAIGIPTLIIGSQRKKTIQNTMNNLQHNALLQIIPSVQYNNTVHGYCTGLTISISF